MATLDDLRARFPHLGFGVYAYEPGGHVTLEIHMPGNDIHTLTGPTLGACIESAFPEVAQPTPEPDEPPDPFG